MRVLASIGLFAFAFVASGLFFYFGVLDFALWLKGQGGDRYEIFKEVGEQFALLFALVSLIAWFLSEVTRYFLARGQRRKTARYWVLYNAVNRVSQDLTVHLYISGIVHGSLYNRVAAHVTDQAEQNGHLSHVPTGSIPVDLHADFNDLRTQARYFLQGFEQTWNNDDVLSEAIAFDFSLLTPNEKSQTLEYFEEYNSLQDTVKFILPFLQPTIRHVPVEDASAPPSPELIENYSVTMFLDLKKIHASLEDRIVDALNLMDLLITEGTTFPLDRKTSFPGIGERIPKLVTRAAQQGIGVDTRLADRYR